MLLSIYCPGRSHIEKAFSGVFVDIEKLVDAQITKAKENDLRVTARFNLSPTQITLQANAL
jgi:hypothetical protein